MPVNKNQLMPKVELHCHFDGSLRTSTIFQYGKQMGLISKEEKCMEETLANSTVNDNTGTLTEYLQKFDFVLKTIRGNPQALWQAATEFCHDKFNDNVRYVEVRYAPHLLTGGELQLEQVVKIITDAFESATKYLNESSPRNNYKNSILSNRERNEPNPPFPNFKIKQILCGIWTCPTWLSECIDLIEKIDPKHKNLVGIDIACDFPKNWEGSQEASTYQKDYARAKSLNLGRTVHAGECAGPDSVIWAIENLKTSRIGHGYELIQYRDKFDQLYKKSDVNKVHFEYCFYSSLLTKSQKIEDHAIRSLDPRVDNVSLSTDNAAMQFSTLSAEYDYIETKVGWKLSEFIQSNLNGLDAAFSDEVDEKYKENFKKIYEWLEKV